MKSVVFISILSVALAVGVSACRHGGDHPHGDHPQKTDHPEKASPEVDHPDHPQ